VRLRPIIVVIFITLFFIRAAHAQSPDGTISGTVFDPLGKLIAGAEVTVVNDATRVQNYTKTNSDGLYVLANLPPGSYRLQIAKPGFKTLIKPDITLNVQDALAINFTLPIGAVSETVTVQGGAPLINTEGAAVSTVIDRNFVESLPLNGRSFNTLLQLTPGVVIAPSFAISSGQFSIGGQRTDANSFSVDGVSANFGVAASGTLGQSGTGTAQAFSALGGTSSLVSVEALQEFRVETSSFAPEFGRSPGGQVIMTTRAGTNDFHGGGYEYFRNNVLDANDWFANAAGEPRAPERHNDFGAFLGGRILRNKTFFFLSYEGARLRLPQTSVIEVPSAYARAQAPTTLAPFLNAYPQPNGTPTSPTAYTAPFTGTFSNAATLNAGSIRVDHTFNDRFSIFGRFNDAPSQTTDRVYSVNTMQFTDVNTKTGTLGLSMLLGNQLSNTLRGNYSTQESNVRFASDSFGGAVPLDSSLLLGTLPSAQSLLEFQTSDTSLLLSGPLARGRTRQLNFVDDLSYVVGTHQLKFGADYRAIFLDVNDPQYVISFGALSTQSLITSGVGSLYAARALPANILTQSFSLYGQDIWKATPKLTLTYGLRWEVNPAPSARGTTTLAAWENVSNPSDLSLAPAGTPLWGTTFGNIAPRVGVAYNARQSGDLVLRAGWGIFYDQGVGQAASIATNFPNSFAQHINGVPVPITNPDQYLLPVSPNPPYPDGIYAFTPNLKLPRSYQWNVAIEKSFEGKQAVSVTYVGQKGINLLRQEALYQPNSNFIGDFLLTQNNAHSNYDALQLQYRRPLSARIQALLNYTWSHSLDNASSDVVVGLSNTVISAASDYASSDFDVRQSFSGAVVFSLPAASIWKPVNLITRDWSLDTVIVARSGLPFNAIVLGNSPDPNGFAATRPDIVEGQALWMTNPEAPGGKSLNPNAFLVPSTVRQGTEGRNDIPGFGLTQVDVSVVRKFPVTERLNLEFRTDAFNLLNHPNFTNPPGYVQFGSFGLQSQQMLNAGLGGLNPLFQEGGPRSLQLSLRLSF
jgi:hypothetical protein